MNNIKELAKGEITRLVKSSILFKYIVIAVGVICLILTSNRLTTELIFSFSTLLIVYLGTLMISMSSLYYEKQNNVLKSIVVLPVKPYEIVLSKIIGVFVIVVIPYVLILGAYVYTNHIDVTVFNVMKIILYPVFVSVINTLVGYLFFVLINNYEKLQDAYIFYGILTIVPSIYFGYANYENTMVNILYSLVPSQALDHMLITNKTTSAFVFAFSVVFLIVLAFVLLKLVNARFLKSIMEVSE